MLSFIVLLGNLRIKVHYPSVCCVPVSCSTNYLLCSISDISDLGILALELISYNVTIKYAYVLILDSLRWVLVVKEGLFILHKNSYVNDPLIKCDNPYLYVPLYNKNKPNYFKGSISRIFAAINELLRNREVASFKVKVSSNNYLTINIDNNDIRRCIKILRMLQEELIKLNLYSVIKCNSRIQKINSHKGTHSILNLFTKYI